MPSDDKLALNVQTENSNELGIEVSNLNRLNRQEFGIKNQDGVLLLLEY
ncbi:MAG: hypothetical protein Ct9H90mP20_2920 [Candidatus Neomarinimicrobiota bacterium]|nr:MAG: hypothetical protein Ct9H90mP20_2920 [Candidatus Neomarinimicrobiota bacterium]